MEKSVNLRINTLYLKCKAIVFHTELCMIERRRIMFRVFQEEMLITILMFTFLGSSIFLRIFLGMLYRNMIKEADNMASTKNRLLKQCKTKFASCYQMSNGVSNIPVFVDKFLNRMSLGHLSFETLYHLSGQLMLLSVVASGVGVCKGIVEGRTLGDVLPFYIVSFFGLYVYFSVSTVVDVRGKKRVLKVNLVDYLENHLSPRIEITRQDIEMLYGESAFEEKKENYGRIQGGRSSRSKNRRGGSRTSQIKPGTKRTVELMPIGNRLAAGGEELEAAEPVAEPVDPAQEMYPPVPSPPPFEPQAQETISEADDSAAVTEEELEALLKEFLTS